MRLASTIIILLMCQPLAHAIDMQSLLHRCMPMRAYHVSMMHENPGVMGYCDSLSISVASFSVGDSRHREGEAPQYGTGERTLDIQAQSYQHLTSKLTVWGDVQFTIGRLNDVRLTNSIDYDMVEPYVLGDEVGGHLQYRKYDFGGGYAYQLNDHLSIGVAVNYRAQIAWRNVDPRVKTIVSDIDAEVGVGYKYGSRHLAGLALRIENYNQNCDLDFYNPLNDITTYPYTGLGTYYKRFVDNANKNSGHQGVGFGIEGQWLTVSGFGPQIKAGVTHMNMTLHLRNFNNIAMAKTSTTHSNLCMGWGAQLSQCLKIMPIVSVIYQNRKGTENLFGTAAGSSYNQIGQVVAYKHTAMTVNLSTPMQMAISENYVSFVPSLEYINDKKALTLEPMREERSRLIATMQLQYARKFGEHWLMSLTSYCRTRQDLAGECSLARNFGPVTGMLKGGYGHLSRNGHCAYVSISAIF